MCIFIENIKTKSNMVDYRVKKAYYNYKNNPSDKTLRMFNKIMNRTYSTINDRKWAYEQLNFKLCTK